jgi:hypothetical protein
VYVYDASYAAHGLYFFSAFGDLIPPAKQMAGRLAPPSLKIREGGSGAIKLLWIVDFPSTIENRSGHFV